MNNPYEAPKSTSVLEETASPNSNELASRWKRFCAAMIDGIIAAVLVAPIAYLLGYYGDYVMTFAEELILTGVSLVGFVAVNGVLIYSRGQTVGKYLLKIKVVTLDLKQVSGNRYLFLREIPAWMAFMIPHIGSYIYLINCLMIFRKDRNCFHDDIARTRVVNI